MAKKDSQYIDLFELKAKYITQLGLNLDTRTLSIMGEISTKSYVKFDKQLSLLETLSDDPIQVIINSEGGEVYSMFSFIARIEDSQCTIITKGSGLIASAAVCILASGDLRTAERNCSFMHHSPSYAAGYDRLKAQNTEAKHTTNLETRMCNFLDQQTKKPAKFWKAKGSNDNHYFDANTALEYGLIDDIVQKREKK